MTRRLDWLAVVLAGALSLAAPVLAQNAETPAVGSGGNTGSRGAEASPPPSDGPSPPENSADSPTASHDAVETPTNTTATGAEGAPGGAANPTATAAPETSGAAEVVDAVAGSIAELQAVLTDAPSPVSDAAGETGADPAGGAADSVANPEGEASVSAGEGAVSSDSSDGSVSSGHDSGGRSGPQVTTRVEHHTETRFVPLDDDDSPDPLAAGVEELTQLFGSDRSLGALALLLLVVLIAALAAVALRRIRDRLEDRGLLPTLLALLHLSLRLLAFAFSLALVIRVLPPRATLVMLLAFAGFALAIGWSARDVLPDLVAGILLVFERRVRRGMWLVGTDFSGQVRRVGVRSTLLVDVMGRQVEVPNRHLVRAPLTSDASGEQEHEVLVRFESESSAEQIRAALRDAVFASPWVVPGSEAVVLRDSDEPWLWRVRGQLLDPTLVARFEGDLLERAEEILAAFEAAGRAPHDVGRSTSEGEEGRGSE